MGLAQRPTATTSTFYLLDDTLGMLDLRCENGYVLLSFEFGFPTVREVANPRSLTDGTYDDTRFVGARAVTIQLGLDGRRRSLQDLLDNVRAYCHPGRRPYLHYLPESGAERRLPLRGADCPTVWDRPDYMTCAAQFVNWTGLAEASDLSSATIIADPYGSEKGRDYDLLFDRHYPDTPAYESVTVDNVGNAPAYWWARIYGDCTNPSLTINGAQLDFSRSGGLSLVAGDYVQVDTRTRAVLASNGEDRYSQVQFSIWTWPLLRPGLNSVIFDADALGAGARAELSWRSVWV